MFIHLSRIIDGELVGTKFCARTKKSKVCGSKMLESVKVIQRRISRMSL